MPAFWMRKQEDHNTKVLFSYIASSRPGWDTWKHMLKKKNQQQTTKRIRRKTIFQNKGSLVLILKNLASVLESSLHLYSSQSLSQVYLICLFWLTDYTVIFRYSPCVLIPCGGWNKHSLHWLTWTPGPQLVVLCGKDYYMWLCWRTYVTNGGSWEFIVSFSS